MSRVNGLVVQIAGRVGVDIMRLRSTRHAVGRRMKMIEAYGIDMVIDVGASVGTYGIELRRFGFRGRIASFEPLSAPFAQLSRTAARDHDWQASQCALGATPGEAEIHVSGHHASSSLLEMLPRHEHSAPGSAFTGAERIKIATLDAVFDEICGHRRRPLLKIDTQGYEDRVLAGGRASLARVEMLQLEMSLIPLYAGQILFTELHAQVTSAGFNLVSVEPGFADDRTGELLQLDGVYHRMRPGA